MTDGIGSEVAEEVHPTAEETVHTPSRKLAELLTDTTPSPHKGGSVVLAVIEMETAVPTFTMAGTTAQAEANAFLCE